MSFFIDHVAFIDCFVADARFLAGPFVLLPYSGCQ